MSYLTAVLLGLVQGITEFLPVSSSGHLALLQSIFHIEEADLFFDVLLHFATLIAVLLSYRRELHGAVQGGLGMLGIGPDRGKLTPKNADRRRLALFLILGTLPLILAIPLKRWAETVFTSATLVSLMLLLTGTILYLTDRFSHGYQSLRDASAWEALAIGVAQAIAVIPGISRSGSTISAGMLCGLKRNVAVQFSFLLCVPAVLGAGFVSLVGAFRAGINVSLLPKYLCGMLAAGISGYFSIRLIRYIAARSNFGGFAYYCWGMGLISLVLSMVA